MSLILALGHHKRGRIQLLTVLHFLVMLMDQLLLDLMLFVKKARVTVEHDGLVLEWLRLVHVSGLFDFETSHGTAAILTRGQVASRQKIGRRRCPRWCRHFGSFCQRGLVFLIGHVHGSPASAVHGIVILIVLLFIREVRCLERLLLAFLDLFE